MSVSSAMNIDVPLSRRSSALNSPTHSDASSSVAFNAIDPEELDFESLQNACGQLQSQLLSLKEENGVMRNFFLRSNPGVSLTDAEEDRDDKRDRGAAGRKRQKRKESRTAPTQLSSEHKVDVVIREVDEMRNLIEKSKLAAERHLEELKAELEEVDTEIVEIKKDAYDFRRDIVTTAENPRTGKIIAEKLVRYIEDRIKDKDGMIDKLRLKNTALKTQITKMETQLQQREEMGEVLLLIDFDQLRIENQQYIDKIEEKNKELLSLKLTTGNTVQVLNALKEKLAKLSMENGQLFDQINSRRRTLESLQTEYENVKEDKANAEKIHNVLQTQHEEIRAPEIMAYIEQKAEMQELDKQLITWQRKVEIVENEMKVARHSARAGSRSSSPGRSAALMPSNR